MGARKGRRRKREEEKGQRYEVQRLTVGISGARKGGGKGKELRWAEGQKRNEDASSSQLSSHGSIVRGGFGTESDSEDSTQMKTAHG